ncbi:MAG: hypothetical protein RIS85_2319 [Pseudomonadota bacterium]
MSALLAPENLPFAAALALLALLVIVQVTGISDFLGDADGHDADLDAGSVLASITGLGALPFIVWLSFFLAIFALVGLSLQQLVGSFLGAPFAALPATAMGLVAAWPVNTVVTRLLSRIWPHDETTAVPLDALLGRRGMIAVGTASRGNPARANVRDLHGQIHLVMVEPHEDSATLVESIEILLVRREGEIFYAIDTNASLHLAH